MNTLEKIYETEDEANLKRVIMRRVKIIYWCRKIRQPVVLESVVIIGTSLVLFINVSFDSVVTNMPSFLETLDLLNFMSVAFSKTELPVQVFSILGILSAGFFAKDIIKYFYQRNEQKRESLAIS